MNEPASSAAATAQQGEDVLENLLIRDKESQGDLYDANAANRFEFEAHIGSERYDTAHVYGAISDERYIQWIDDFKIKAKGEDNVHEESRESDVKCWDDIIIEVENIEVPEGADWKALIPASEKSEGLKQLFAVAPVEADEKTNGPRRLGTSATEQVITTEAWFNGKILQQRHILTPKTLELEKKFERIQAKRTKTEQTRGLRRKPIVEFVAQDDKLGKLYDEMLVRTEGFAGDIVPLRFKTAVMYYVFAPTLDPKLTSK